MYLDWTALGEVAAVSTGVTVGVVVGLAFGREVRGRASGEPSPPSPGWQPRLDGRTMEWGTGIP